MNVGRKINTLNKCLAFVLVFLCASLCAFSVENSLSEVGIKQSENNNYQVFLKLDKKAQIKKIVDGSDNLTLIVNSTLPSESMEIIYDSEDSLANIIVQKRNDNNTLISLQGQNMANAEIITKEISTGSVKKLDSNENILSGLLFIADKKVLGFSLVGILFLFFMMLSSKPKNRKYSSSNVNKSINQSSISANTLRNKNLIQSRNVPSINYKVNGSFGTSNAHTTMPKDLVANNQKQTIREQQIRKAG